MISRLMLVFFIAVAVGVAGCAGRTKVESDLHIKGAPDWVNEGTNMLRTRDGRLFHGVGSAPPLGDRSLQTETADNRARAELARALSSYMDVVSRDYTAAAGSGEAAVKDATVSRQIENVTRVNLAGSRIIGRWRDERTDIIYSLAELDMEEVQSNLQRVHDMNQELRSYMAREGVNIFDRMAEEGR